MAVPSGQESFLDMQQALAGLMGSSIMVLRDPVKRSRAQQIAAIIGGTGSAIYLTPLVGDLFRVEDPKFLLGFSFLFGCLGLRSIEIIADKFEKLLIKKSEDIL